jgi:hypothetical protein
MLAVDRGGSVGCQEDVELGDFLGSAGTADRDTVKGVHQFLQLLSYGVAVGVGVAGHPVGEPLRGRGFDEAGPVLLTRSPCGPTWLSSPLL